MATKSNSCLSNTFSLQNYSLSEASYINTDPHSPKSADILIEDWIEKPHFTGNQRTLRVWLDTNQYHSDMSKTMKGHGEDVYKSFNLILRRKAKESFIIDDDSSSKT